MINKTGIATLLLACTALVFSSFSVLAVELKSDKDRYSYGIGTQIGMGFQRQQLDVDLDALIQGMRDALAGRPMAMNPDEIKDALTQLQQSMRKRMEQVQRDKQLENRDKGEKFLRNNRKNKKVKVTNSGLQYQVMRNGKSKQKPRLNDTVTTHYRGTLINGTEFDSSYKRGKPAEFKVNGVIKGWTEALQLMTVGSKWKLFIPANLAYGERGAAPNIGPDETLVFEIELMSVVKKKKG